MMNNSTHFEVELLIGIAQRHDVDGVRGVAVLQSGFEPSPGSRIDPNGEHVDMQEPALPPFLPSGLDAAHHNRASEAGAVQTFAQHLTGAPKVRIRQRVRVELVEIDGRDLMLPYVRVGQGMELSNRAHPIIARAHGADRQPATMLRAAAPEKRATNVKQARQ
jgi:hypothetical protein